MIYPLSLTTNYAPAGGPVHARLLPFNHNYILLAQKHAYYYIIFRKYAVY